MQSRVYVTVMCPSVHPSIPSRSSGVRRDCCWAPCGQDISIDSGERWASSSNGAAARRSAANAGSPCWQPSWLGVTHSRIVCSPVEITDFCELVHPISKAALNAIPTARTLELAKPPKHRVAGKMRVSYLYAIKIASGVIVAMTMTALRIRRPNAVIATMTS